MTLFDVWKSALTEPREETYASIAALPEASMERAALYVFLASLVSSILSLPASWRMFTRVWGGNQGFGGLAFSLVMLSCGALVMAVLMVLLYFIFTGLVNWVAGMFGGTGQFAQLFYAFAAIGVPVSLASAVLNLFAMIPFLGFVFSLASMGLALYTLYLNVLAIKGVHGLGTGQAVGALFIPAVGLGILFGCLALIAVLVAGASGMLESLEMLLLFVV